MPVMNRMQFARSLDDGVRTIFGMEYDDYAPEYSKIFDVVSSDRAWEEEQMYVGLGLAYEKAEGGTYARDSGSEGWTKRYHHRSLGLSFEITEEAIDDNRYVSLVGRFTRSLARSMRVTRDVYAANVLNNATDTAYVGGDGVPLLSAAHPLVGGGVQSNILATAADVSESAIEEILQMIRRAKDERGLPARLRAKQLITAPEQEFNARRVLGTPRSVGNDYNDINVVKSMGLFGADPTVLTHLTDEDAWFVQTNCPDGMKFYERMAGARTKVNIDPATDNYICRAKDRFSEGWTNWRGLYGSA